MHVLFSRDAAGVSFSSRSTKKEKLMMYMVRLTALAGVLVTPAACSEDVSNEASDSGTGGTSEATQGEEASATSGTGGESSTSSEESTGGGASSGGESSTSFSESGGETTDGSEDAAEFEEALQGTWQASCVPLDSGDSQPPTWSRSTIINGDVDAFSFEIFGDSECTEMLARFEIRSGARVGPERGDIAENTRELDVFFEDILATAYADAFVETFEMAGCGSRPWEVGEAQSVAETGCSSFEAIADCPADYDLVRIDGDRLYTGVRTGNQCDPAGRPDTLNEWFFERLEE